MRAEILSHAEFRQWSGPKTAVSPLRPYVFSDPVPEGQLWILIAASGLDTFPGSEAVWLYAIPPGFAFKSPTGPILRPDLFTGADGNAPPLKGGVQLTKGGNNGAPEVSVTAGINNSVNLVDFASRK